MCTSPFEERKNIFEKLRHFLDFEILQFLANTLWNVCILSSSYSFKAINQKLCTDVTGILKICTCFFHSFLAVDLKLCIATTAILKMCTYHFFGRKMEEGQEKQPTWETDKRNMEASYVSYRHNFLVYFENG